MASRAHLHLRLISVDVAGDIANVIYAVGESPDSQAITFSADLSGEVVWGFSINDGWNETKRVTALLSFNPVEFWGTMMPMLDDALKSHFTVAKTSNVIPLRRKD